MGLIFAEALLLLSFHSIAPGHLTNLNDLKINNLVIELINYRVCPILSTLGLGHFRHSGTVTPTISRQPKVFKLKLAGNRILFCLPSLINNRK